MQDRTEYKQYAATFLSEMDLTVYAISEIEDFHTEGASLFLQCRAACCSKESVGSSFNQVNRYFINRGESEPAALRLDFLEGNMLRLRLQRGETVQEVQRIMLQGVPAPAAKLLVQDSGSALTASAGVLEVRLCKKPFHLSVYAGGQLIYCQYNNDLHSTTNDRRRGLNEAESTLTPEEVQRSYPAFEVYPFGYVRQNSTGALCYTEAVCTAYDEAFFGFGESFSPGNKRGEEKLIWAINPLGASTIKSYKNIPFFMSNAGYGLYLNSAKKSLFDMNSYFFKAHTISSFDDQLDLFFLYGPSYPRLLQSYSRLTGPCLHVPPKWSFGVWMGRNCYRSRAEIEDTCRELRQRQLPCDVLHLDWDYTRLATHGFDFIFDEARFPDPAGMMAEMQKQGYRLSLWQLPYLNKGTPVYDFCLEKGYFSAPPPGKTREGDPVGVLDFSNPEAVAWYQQQLRALLQAGVAVIKTDFGENADEDYLYKTVDGAEMHNLYPLLYNQAAYEVCEEVHGKEALVWGRSAFSGGQRYPLYWGGDSDSDYHGLYDTLRGGLSLGLTGFPFWSHDVGGYFGRPDEDVYIRWVQLGMLSSHVRFHGTTPREPWHYGETAVEVYRHYAAIRYSLIEYLYTEAHHAAESCQPMMRHLVLDFPGDPTVQAIDDQYMLGRSLLVAGVFDTKPCRRLYLPKGRWLDWHTEEILEGGRWLDYPVPLTVLPLFVRFGSILPLVEPKNHVDETPDTCLRWKVLPAAGPMEAEVLGLESPVRLRAEWQNNRLVFCLEGSLPLRHLLEIHGVGGPTKVEGGQVLHHQSQADALLFEMDAGRQTAALHF